MNDLAVTNISGVDCYEKDGVAYLNLEAVARGLGFVDVRDETEYVRWARVDKYLEDLNFATSGERPKFIPENIFYRLAMKAKNPAAEAFQAKVADEIIPAIRKHGLYATPDTIEKMLEDPDVLINALVALKEERAKRKELEAENEVQRQAIEDFKPVQQYVNLILSSKDTLATTQIAADYDLSAKALNKILHEEGLQHNVNGQWVLYRKHMGKGLTSSETIHYTHKDGRQGTKIMTKWTQKGRLKIHEILESRGILAVMDIENMPW